MPSPSDLPKPGASSLPRGASLYHRIDSSGAKLVGVLALVFGLAGCAQAPGPPPHVPLSAKASSTPSAGDPLTDEAKEVLPAHELDAKTLYQLLMAEIAAQRGMPAVSFVAEYNLAKETRDPRIARRATEFALMTHQPAPALQAARLWQELSPLSADARGTVLTILVLSGRMDEAEPILRDVIAKAPAKGTAFEQVAATLARAPNHADAYALMQRLAKDYQQLPEVHMALAESAQGAGDHAHAIAEAQTAARLAPDEVGPVVLSAQYLQTDEPKQAEAVLKEYLTRHADSAEVRMAYARFLVGQKRYGDASGQFESLLKAHPNDTNTLYALGLLAYQAEHPDDAEKYFKRFITLRSKETATPTDDDEDTAPTVDTDTRTVASAYLYLAQIAEDQKAYSQALDYLNQIDDPEDFLNARMRRAFILAHQGKLDVALGELHDLPIHSDSDRVQVVLTESQLLRDANRSVEALALIDQALAQQPDDPDLLYDQGMTAEKLNRLDLMESALRKLIKLQPENAQAYNALGYTFADRNIRLDEARELIEKAIALAPDDASIIDSLGWVQYRLGNNPSAVQNLERAYHLRGDAEIAVHLGEVLWVTGHHEEAEKYWKEADRKEPDNEVLRATLARFNVRVGSL